MGYGATTAEISQIGVGDPEGLDWKIVIDRRESNGKIKVFQVNETVVVPYSAVLWIRQWLAMSVKIEWWSTYDEESAGLDSCVIFFEDNEIRVSAYGVSVAILRENVRIY